VNVAGSIELACDASRGRTRLRTIRCEGLSRSSRALREPSGAIRLVLSALGPGVLAGDSFTLTGTVDEAATLTACGRMATPVFAGDAPSEIAADWEVAAGATLLVAGEPLVLEPGSMLRARATFAVQAGGRAISVDTFALRGAARLSMRTQATLAGRLVYRDAFETSATDAAYGTVAVICATAAARSALLEAAPRVGMRFPTVRMGSGETSGAAIVRLRGADLWDVRAAAFALAEAVRTAD